MSGHWHAPVDPDCPKVARFRQELYDDPLTAAMGVPVDEIMESFEDRHRRECKQCQEYGAAHIEASHG